MKLCKLIVKLKIISKAKFKMMPNLMMMLKFDVESKLDNDEIEDNQSKEGMQI